MNENLKVFLHRLAEQTAACDDEEFAVDDYAGGNMDDAYSVGENDGEILLARELLAMFGDVL